MENMRTSAIIIDMTEEEENLRRKQRKRVVAAFTLLMLLASGAFTLNSMIDIRLMHSAVQGQCMMEVNKALNETMAMGTMYFDQYCSISLTKYYDTPPVKLFVEFLYIGTFVRLQMATFLLADVYSKSGVKSPKGYFLFTGLVVVAVGVLATYEILQTSEVKEYDTEYYNVGRIEVNEYCRIFRHCLFEAMMTAMFAVVIAILRSSKP